MIAQLVLYSYPLVVLIMFRRLPRHEALIWSVLIGYLFLPERIGIDLPLLPPFSKSLIPSLTAGLMCLMIPDADNLKARRGHRTGATTSETPQDDAALHQSSIIANLCLIVVFLVPVGVFLTNSDPVVFGPRRIGGVRIYDIFSMILSLCVILLPFLLARRYLRTPKAQVALLRALVIGGLIYSALILIEVRLSPQLNKWIYGFYSHSFLQHIRAGGFRPMVFLEHGLRVGIFISMTCLAAVSLWRVKTAMTDQGPGETRHPKRRTASPKKPPYALYAAWLFVILFLSKTFGAFLIAFALLPVAIFFNARSKLIVAACVAATVLIYPALRATDVFPIERITNILLDINEPRGYSFEFRVQNEDALLERASEKPAFGWGIWGRARVYDAQTGEDLSVTDGVWVLVFGQTGWFGYLAQFGLLTFPTIALGLARRDIGMAGSGLCLLLAANLLDLLPNSGLTPLTWLIAGTVLAIYENPVKKHASALLNKRASPVRVATRVRTSPG